MLKFRCTFEDQAWRTGEAVRKRANASSSSVKGQPSVPGTNHSISSSPDQQVHVLADRHAADMAVVARQRHEESAKGCVCGSTRTNALAPPLIPAQGAQQELTPTLQCPRRTCRSALAEAKHHQHASLPLPSSPGPPASQAERTPTFPYMTYSQSSASPPSIPARHPPSPSFSPSGNNDEASANEKVDEGVIGSRSVLICANPC